MRSGDGSRGGGHCCNAAAPGWIGTEQNTRMIDAAGDPQAFRANPGRREAPEEVVALVAFLAAEESGRPGPAPSRRAVPA